MKADYDSEADAILIDIVDVDHWDHEIGIDDYSCAVAIRAGKPVAVSLLYPRENFELLDEASRRFELDAVALRATARAALAAPDHVVTVGVDARVLGVSEVAA
jgi:hypothetical protein